MSVKSDQKTPSIDTQLLNQLLAGKKTAGEIEDLLKDLRKAFIEHALQGELTDLLGYPKHQAEGRNSRRRSGYCSSHFPKALTKPSMASVSPTAANCSNG